MQRIAQDWLVLTQLTHHDASAVGVVMSLQFAPQLLLLPWTGIGGGPFQPAQTADGDPGRDGRTGARAGRVDDWRACTRLWQLDVFAFLFGCAAALDAPVRQTFVGELVGDELLPNAVALNSTSFNAAPDDRPGGGRGAHRPGGHRLGVFAQRSSRSAAVLLSLGFLRVADLRPNARAPHRAGGFLEGFRYVWSRAELRGTLVMLFLIGTFGLNFPIFISTMAVGVFHADAKSFGLLTSIMAVGHDLRGAARRPPGPAAVRRAAGGFGGLRARLHARRPGSRATGGSPPRWRSSAWRR